MVMTHTPRRRVAVLLRGIAYAPTYVHFSRTVHRIDFRETAAALVRQLISPLAVECGGFDNVDLFAVTYHAGDFHDACLRETFGTPPLRLRATEFHAYTSSATQVDLLTAGLAMVASHAAVDDVMYDRIIVVRFDVKFHEGVDVVPFLFPQSTVTDFMLPWREREVSRSDMEPWEPGCQVGDALHSLMGNDIDAFIDALSKCTARTNMHMFYPQLLEALSSRTQHAVKFMVPATYHDSNTDKVSNPVYRLHRHVLRRHFTHDLNFYKRFSANMPVHRFFG